MARARYLVRRLIHHFFPGPGYVRVAGSVIPAPEKRWCGPEFKSDRFYLQSAESEARRLQEHFGCSNESRILDLGCGQGRLPIGLLRVIGDVNYLGIDIDKPSIEWCSKHIGDPNPNYNFMHLDLYNERYNKEGAEINDQFHFDIPSHQFDIAYLFSVFSHTTEDDLRVYLKEIHRVLDDSGSVFFTTFVEEGVPPFSVNPDGYRLKCSGPLHVVRYSKEYLFDLVQELGYEVVHFTYATEADGQSAIYLAKRLAQ